MSAAGLDFSNLALVAGALGVGKKRALDIVVGFGFGFDAEGGEARGGFGGDLGRNRRVGPGEDRTRQRKGDEGGEPKALVSGAAAEAG